MRRYKISSRYISLLLALAMIFGMIPVLEFGASASATGSNPAHGLKLTSADKITMPIKIMDYESDGMLFDYLFGVSNTASSYKPETTYWYDFTGTLSGTAGSKGSTYGSGMDTPQVAAASGYHNNEQKMTTSESTFGLNVINNRTNGEPLQWQIADFKENVAFGKIRYAAIVYRGYSYNINKDNPNPRMGISTTLTDADTKYNSGKFSGWYYLPGSGYGDQFGDRNVDVAIIDLCANGIKTTDTIEKLYLDFPMLSDGVTNDKRQYFDLVAVGYFSDRGDAEEFGYWGSSIGSISSNSGSDNQGFSFLRDSDTFVGRLADVAEWAETEGYPNGEKPVHIELNSYGYEADGTTATYQEYEDEIGYRLIGNITDKYSLAVIGLLQPSLDENGRPVYKEIVVDYMVELLQLSLVDLDAYNSTGWRNYASIAGAPNGKIFGYGPGGQGAAGGKNIPMDFATAACAALKVGRKSTSTTTGTVGSYKQTVAKSKYLTGAWLDCVDYIDTWYDLAWYMLHNLFVVNSYNELQSDYNYMHLYKSQTNNTYVFDSGFTTSAGYNSSAVTYNDDKTIGLSGATYKGYLTHSTGTIALANPFLPVTDKNTEAKESTNLYYMDDGVNVSSDWGLWYDNKNYGYTMACNGEFEYQKGLTFDFEGDDDVYLFINGELVMDLGATHAVSCANISLDSYVSWAQNVLKNRKNYSLDQVARAEKLNLKDGETYSFDFFYMERHGTGANFRIETNINVVVPELNVEKVASQNGVDVPDHGVVDNSEPVEYGFSLTNDGDTSKLYNLSFVDSEIGITLTPENGLEVKYPKLTKDKDGGELTASDVVAYVDGYTGDPSRPSTKKIDTIKVTFADNDELKQFLTDLSSDDGTQSTATDSLYSGNGLWAYATVTIRGFYYTQTVDEQANASFTNPVRATANNGAYKLSGNDTHTVYPFGEPAYFQWAGKEHQIVIDSEKLYSDLKNSKTYGESEIAQPGHMELTLCDANGNPMEYPYVSNSVGGDVYLTANFPNAGLYTVYLKIADKTGVAPTLTAAIMFYVLNVKDSAVVLDYGLIADLSSGNGLYSGDTISLAGKDTLNTVMAITGVTANPGYVKQDVSNQHSVVNTQNNITQVAGTSYTAYSGEFDTPVYLRHDLPWVIEWETTGNHPAGLLFSMNYVGSVENNTYVYVCNGSNNQYFVSMGRFYNSYYDNHGVPLEASQLSTAHKYRLVNQPYTDGTNKVVLYIAATDSDDYEMVGDLKTYWLNTTLQNTVPDFINGKDFTFNFIGSKGHPIKLTNLKYINVYEQGLELNNYRWEYNTTSKAVEGVTTGEAGNVLNAMDYWSKVSSSDDTDGYLGRLNRWVELSCDREWVIEFKYSGLDLAGHANNVDGDNEEAMILTSTGTTEHEYLYLRADNGLVAFGTRDSAGYHNFGIAIKDIKLNFDTSAEHIYRIENRINADGTCMAYLIVDGEELGPMINEFNSGTPLPGITGDMFTGNNMMFTHVGHNTGLWGIDGTLHYLQVWEDTSLSGCYGWAKNSTTKRLEDASVSDPDGNRINFVADGNGVLIDSAGESGQIAGTEGTFTLDGNNLTFKPEKFMQGGSNSIKIAVTVHDRDFVPTPLTDKTVDIAHEVQMFKNISVIPATVVYYEDDFPAIQYTSKEENKFEHLGDGSDTLIQGSDYDENYGSDDAYNDATVNMSGNSLSVITIDNNGPLASFDFSGTGFEIVARTNASNSGALFVQVYKQTDLDLDASGKIQYNATTGLPLVKSNAKVVASIPVITEFDNNNDNGAEELYQIPIIRVKDLEKNNYTAIIFGTPTNMEYDETNKVWVPKAPYDYLYLDGIRIFQPIGSTNAGYRDVENGAIFVEIRDEIIDGYIAVGEYDQSGSQTSISAGLTTWTENHLGQTTGDVTYIGNTVNSVNDYLTLGPNNEVYMDGTFTNSAIILHVAETDAAVHNLQIAVRAMDYGQFVGAGHIYEHVKIMYSVLDGSRYVWKELVTINNGTEQYYTIPYDECLKLAEGCYQVVIQVQAVEEDVPALASFSSLKYSGLEIVSVSTAVLNGYDSVSGNEVLSFMSEQLMSTDVVDENETLPDDSFKPSDSETGDAPALIPQYPSLSLKDEVYYNIYYSIENFADGSIAEMGLLTFNSELADGTIDDAVSVIPGASYNGVHYTVRSNGISAKNLADTLYFKVYAKLVDGSYVYSDVHSYSALTYAENRLNSDATDAEKALIVAMLNYGAAAQEFFGYKTDALMNAGLTDEQKALVASYSASMVDDLISVDAAKIGQFAATANGFARKYPSISVTGAFSINYYFSPEFEIDNGMTLYYWTEDAYTNADVLTADNASGVLAMTDLGNGQFLAGVNGIAAKDIGETIFVAGIYESNGTTYSTGVLTYGLSAYCKNHAEDTSSDVQNIAAAIAVYGYYAENYFVN